jgi:hypothetical protein
MQNREISIEDYSPDISAMADQMYLGPQGQILEDLNTFNNNYTNQSGMQYRDGRELLPPLEVTKKFRWKPGTYAKVKKMYEHYVMRWQIRPRGVNSLFNRRRDYYHRQMSQQLDRIEQLMVDRRRQGAVWSENPEQLVADFNQFKEDLTTELDTVRYYLNDLPDNDENPDISCYISVPDGANLHDELSQAMIVVQIHWNKLDLNVRNLERNLLQTIPGWNTGIKVTFSLLKWFNQYHGHGREWKKITSIVNRMDRISIRGRFAPPHNNMAHPFISSSRDARWTNTCTGDMTNGIIDSFIKRDWVGMYNLTTMWLTEFVAGYTGPLNSPNYMHIGIPKDWNPEYVDAVGVRTNWCIDQVLSTSIEDLSFKRHGYCKEIECQLMESCDGFQHEEQRAENIIKAIPNISEICDIATPFSSEQTRSIYGRLQDICYVNENEELILKYQTLTGNDWKYLIHNKSLGLITDYLGLKEDWWDMDVPANPDTYEDQEALENEMITWAVSRNPNVANPPIQGDREQDIVLDDGTRIRQPF